MYKVFNLDVINNYLFFHQRKIERTQKTIEFFKKFLAPSLKIVIYRFPLFTKSQSH